VGGVEGRTKNYYCALAPGRMGFLRPSPTSPQD
jgi:hypothetical protein